MSGWRHLAVIFLLLFAREANAEIAPQDLSQVEAKPIAGAQLPLSQSFTDDSGRVVDLKKMTGSKPIVLVFADYTCSYLCGPTLSLVGNALIESGLNAQEDFRFIVIGIDPKDKVSDAQAMKHAQLPEKLQQASLFLTGNEENIRAATNALGYRYKYDPAHDQYAHSADIYILDSSGRVSSVLNGLAIGGRDLRLSLVSASQGSVGNFRDHVQLICYGFDPAKGTYSVAVNRILFAACCATVLSLIGLILFLSLVRPARKA